MPQTLPSVTHSTVYHVGNLDGDRTTPYVSYEGGGLSVSDCPRDWARIMETGGTVYKLTHPSGKREFFAAAVKDKPRSFVRDWCLGQNYVTETTLYRSEWTDEEGTNHFMLFDDHETASVEADAAGRNGVVRTVDGLTLDSQGVAYWEETFQQSPEAADPLVIRDILPVWFAAAHGFDGVWWDEKHDPANYSAPRGVIFQSALDEWDSEKVGTAP